MNWLKLETLRRLPIIQRNLLTFRSLRGHSLHKQSGFHLSASLAYQPGLWREGIIVCEWTSHPSNKKSGCCFFSHIDIEIGFKGHGLVQSKSFDMNRLETYIGSQVVDVGWMSGTLFCDNSLSLPLSLSLDFGWGKCFMAPTKGRVKTLIITITQPGVVKFLVKITSKSHSTVPHQVVAVEIKMNCQHLTYRTSFYYFLGISFPIIYLLQRDGETPPPFQVSLLLIHMN